MVVASVEVPVTVKRPVVVAFTKFDEVTEGFAVFRWGQGSKGL